MATAERAIDRTGQLIAGKYRVIKQLGEGGFGVVWLASQDDIGRKIVLKVLHPQWAQVAVIVERFRREAVATNRVAHPNICKIFDYAMTDDGVPYIAMEYLEGGTLKEAVRVAGGQLSVARVAELMAPVCDALDVAHGSSIVHRDLKPENIMIAWRDGVHEEAVVLDFGIAKLMDAADKLTQTGSMLGTPTYMSPEQCRGMKDIGPPADVYSLAVIVFELLSGATPFKAKTVAELAMKHVLDVPPPLVGVPPAVAQIIAQCLAKEPQQRPTASGLGNALREAARALGPQALVTTAKRASPVAATVNDPHAAATMMSTGTGADLEKKIRAELAGGKRGLSWGILVMVVVTLGALGCLVALLLR